MCIQVYVYVHVHVCSGRCYTHVCVYMFMFMYMYMYVCIWLYAYERRNVVSSAVQRHVCLDSKSHVLVRREETQETLLFEACHLSFSIRIVYLSI